MAGSPGIQHGPRVMIIAIALAAAAQAQTPSLPSPTPPSDFASVVGGPETFVQPTFAQPTGAVPSYYAGEGSEPTATRVEMGLFDTITESIFGQPDPNTWRPLPLSTLFSEGWNEAWVPSPNGSGGAPGKAGSMPRTATFTGCGSSRSLRRSTKRPRGNAYLGAYTLYTPLSRRLLLIINIPFVVRNNAVTGLPILDPNRPVTPMPKSHSGFGDMSFTPRVLLHETKDFSLTAELAVLTPTGTQPLAGKTALIPAFGFWNNFAGRWVIRGGLGLVIPIEGGGSDNSDQPARHRSDIDRS